MSNIQTKNGGTSIPTPYFNFAQCGFTGDYSSSTIYILIWAKPALNSALIPA